ncbi:MAG: alanine racemase [Peptococcaceae bacterium]|nr:alanine racemase [Peptococcaceae bacterium]
MSSRPARLEINLNAIRHNIEEIRRIVAPAEVMGVVKANAYGHGMIETARTCLEGGASQLAVAIANEGVTLREAGFTVPILIFGWVPAEDYPRLLEYNLTPTIFSYEEATILNNLAAEKNIQFPIHLKVDTGMTRLGVNTDAAGMQEAAAILSLPHLTAVGVYTHLACADEEDRTYTELQIDKFKTFVHQLEETTGHTFTYKHMANSSAILNYPEAHLDMVRPGIITYGCYLSPCLDRSKGVFYPAMTLKAKIARVNQVPAGTRISYNSTYTTKSACQIATLPIGYADGYDRGLSNKAEVLYKNYRFPIVGTICMDQCMILIDKDIPIQAGEEVILIGANEYDAISCEDLGKLVGSGQVEFMTRLTNRLPRKYVETPLIYPAK